MFASINSHRLDPVLCRYLADTLVDCFRVIQEEASSRPRSKLNQIDENDV
jgi:hypothetical protein